MPSDDHRGLAFHFRDRILPRALLLLFGERDGAHRFFARAHAADGEDGKLARRAELDKELLSADRVGDQLVVTKLDRLGRSLEHLIELANLSEAREVDLVVLDQGIDASTVVGRMFLQILGAIAEFEHALMSKRTRGGLAAARARGAHRGPNPKLGSSPGRCGPRGV